jgi:hypothetical protein
MLETMFSSSASAVSNFMSAMGFVAMFEAIKETRENTPSGGARSNIGVK